jgi:outer membrane biosynthesis protein TonB
MKKRIQSLWFLSALALFLSVGISLNAQDSSAPQTQAPDAQSQASQTPQAQPAAPPSQEAQPSQSPESQSQPSQTQQAPPSQSPDASAPANNPDAQATSGQASGAQSFTGTIVKSGDKYKFQDADTGNTYDIDHQDQVQKFEGKKVKVHGTLDQSTKTIHVQ